MRCNMKTNAERERKTNASLRRFSFNQNEVRSIHAYANCEMLNVNMQKTNDKFHTQVELKK